MLFQNRLQALQSQIDLPVFSGPLDLLLHLINRQELDITAVSLSQVTEQYLAQVETFQRNVSTGRDERAGYLIDFIVVGARLLAIKSRALLPQPPATADAEEDDPSESLVRQLKAYQRFKEAAAWLGERDQSGLRTYLRLAPPPKAKITLDLGGVTAETLQAALAVVVARARKLEESVEPARGREMTIEDQVENLRKKMRENGRALFHEILPAQASRVEVALTLLAVLELLKRREITASQPVPFGPIELAANGQGPGPLPRQPSQ